MVSCHDQHSDHHHLRRRREHDASLLQTKQESTQLFSSLLSRESSRSNSSCRDRFLLYYGGASGAIPFVWESRPGTPKNTLSDTASLVPPLTPPPSYHSISKSKSKFPHSSSKPTLLIATIFLPFRKNKRTHASPSPSLSSGSSSSSSWSRSSSPLKSKSSSSGSKGAIRYEDDYGSIPKSACVRKQKSKRLIGCFPSARGIKSALRCLVGRRSSVEGVRG